MKRREEPTRAAKGYEELLEPSLGREGQGKAPGAYEGHEGPLSP